MRGGFYDFAAMKRDRDLARYPVLIPRGAANTTGVQSPQGVPYYSTAAFAYNKDAQTFLQPSQAFEEVGFLGQIFGPWWGKTVEGNDTPASPTPTPNEQQGTGEEFGKAVGDTLGGALGLVVVLGGIVLAYKVLK